MNKIIVLIIILIIYSNGCCMNNTPEGEIVLVYQKQNYQQCKLLFKEFSVDIKLPYSISFKYTPDYLYEKYKSDLATILRGYSDNAELIDTRNLKEYKNQPTRLLFTNNFFSLPKEEKYANNLHELGHYFTNPDLIKIRNYIADDNPKLLSIRNPTDSMKNLLKLHNESVNYIFQIPKLVQEINAELWVYNNYPNYSELRLQNYCSDLHNYIQEFRNAKPDGFFLFQIPKLNFLLLWRKLIVRHTNFPFSKDCLLQVDELLNLLDQLAVKSNCNKLKIITNRSELEKTLEYHSENIVEVQSLYESMFKDFIMNSIMLFPNELRNDIKVFYGI